MKVSVLIIGLILAGSSALANPPSFTCKTSDNKSEFTYVATNNSGVTYSVVIKRHTSEGTITTPLTGRLRLRQSPRQKEDIMDLIGENESGRTIVGIVELYPVVYSPIKTALTYVPSGKTLYLYSCSQNE